MQRRCECNETSINARGGPASTEVSAGRVANGSARSALDEDEACTSASESDEVSRRAHDEDERRLKQRSEKEQWSVGDDRPGVLRARGKEKERK